MINQQIVDFCAEEVRRQKRGPIQVAWMVEAWAYARVAFPMYGNFLPIIEELGRKVERGVNNRGWRIVPVLIIGGSLPVAKPHEIPDRMERWNILRGDGVLTPEEIYEEFEKIHPFLDGNGRVGKIIYNWAKGTLDNPVFPPNFFGGEFP